MTTAPKHSEDDAFKLVGEYLYNWAYMEGRLNGVIRKLLGMDLLHGAIACANISLKNKIHIAKTAVSLEFSGEPQKIEHYHSILNKMDNAASQDRNMIAHEMFSLDYSKEEIAVKWYKVSAKGSLKLPDHVWLESDFQDRFTQIRTWTNQLGELEGQVSIMNIAKALMKPPLPKHNTGLLGLLGLPPPQEQPAHTLGNLDASGDTSPRTPQASED